MQCPAVFENVIDILPDFQDRVMVMLGDEINRGFGVELGNGPYISCANYSLHAMSGAVEAHQDGAGYTLGLVVIAEGDHCLVVQGTSLPLRQGSVFLIDSDEMHATTCDSDCGLFAFVTRDFFHVNGVPSRPLLSVEQFAQEAMTGIHGEMVRLLEDAATAERLAA